MHLYQCLNGFPWWLSSKELIFNAGDTGSIPGLGRPPGEGNGNPFHYSCLDGVARIRHNLETKPKPPLSYKVK